MGKWVSIHGETNRALAEMLAETLRSCGIPAKISVGGSMRGLGGYPIGTQSAAPFGAMFYIEVPQKLAERARKIIDEITGSEVGRWAMR